jgi:hypothetical protein
MYQASCDTSADNPRYFTSYNVGVTGDDPYVGTSGAVTESRLNPQIGALDVVATHHFPECQTVHGIAAASACGPVGLLCRREADDTDFDHDAVAAYSAADWMTATPGIECDGHVIDHLWLYEWPDGDLSKEPVKTIVHKSIGTQVWSQNYLRYSDAEDTFGFSVHATKYTENDGLCHVAEVFLMLDRATHTFDPGRGWYWSCGHGHTVHNRPAYDPVSGKFASFCSTDAHQGGVAGAAEIRFRREDQSMTVEGILHALPRPNQGQIKGGAGPLVPRVGGGFLALFVGEPSPKMNEFDDTTPVQIGLFKFDASGAKEGDLTWIASDSVAYYTSPQIAPLGDGTFLFAWAESYHAGTKTSDSDRNRSFAVPWTYWMVEIDEDGNRLTDPVEVTEAGFGEVNEIVPLGKGRVAWTYVPTPLDRRDPVTFDNPDCEQDSLAHHVYTSARVQ